MSYFYYVSQTSLVAFEFQNLHNWYKLCLYLYYIINIYYYYYTLYFLLRKLELGEEKKNSEEEKGREEEELERILERFWEKIGKKKVLDQKGRFIIQFLLWLGS